MMADDEDGPTPHAYRWTIMQMLRDPSVPAGPLDVAKYRADHDHVSNSDMDVRRKKHAAVQRASKARKLAKCAP